MCMKKKCSSPSASIGELSARTTSAIPVQNSRLPPARHRLPAAGERPRAAQVEERPRRASARPAAARSSTACSSDGEPTSTWKTRRVHLFHYHLVTSQLRDVEARYLGKLGFDLVAPLRPDRRRARRGRARASPGRSSTTTASSSALSELERGSVNVVVQPGHWRSRGSTTSASRSTRTTSRRCSAARCSGTCACRSTAAAGRSSRRTPATGSRSTRRASGSTSCSTQERRARGSPSCSCAPTSPATKAGALADILGLRRDGTTPSTSASTIVRFLPGGPEGRPELYGERFD